MRRSEGREDTNFYVFFIFLIYVFFCEIAPDVFLLRIYTIICTTVC